VSFRAAACRADRSDKHADALVAGDDDLHAIPNPAVEIITPRELLDLLGD
jgi:hypothetical protein